MGYIPMYQSSLAHKMLHLSLGFNFVGILCLNKSAVHLITVQILIIKSRNSLTEIWMLYLIWNQNAQNTVEEHLQSISTTSMKILNRCFIWLWNIWDWMERMGNRDLYDNFRLWAPKNLYQVKIQVIICQVAWMILQSCVVPER